MSDASRASASREDRSPNPDGQPPDVHVDTNVASASRRLRAAAVSQRRRPRAVRGRLAVLAMLVVAALGATWYYSRDPEAPTAPVGGHIAFVDTEGWYRRTPNEVAVLSPFDLSLDALPSSLPHELGPWIGAERAHDPAVDEWFRSPDVTIERTYRRGDGEIVWLSAFGSKGPKSFHLFEHTPDTCYPLGGWAIEEVAVEHLPAGAQPMSVNRGHARRGPEQLVFLYFYVWDTPVRDASEGVLSVRIAAPVAHAPDETLVMLAEDFLPEIFPTTVRWTRF